MADGDEEASGGAFGDRERRYVERARVGRLATADGDGRPHAVPVCFAFAAGDLVTPIDEKPKDAPPGALRRLRDIEANPYVALIVDHYAEAWSRLGWVQIRGRATRLDPGADGHAAAVGALRAKYDQYADHALEERAIVRISVGSVRSWGRLDRPDHRGGR
jgi:PPOX class probable F420-dependent enzyme